MNADRQAFEKWLKSCPDMDMFFNPYDDSYPHLIMWVAWKAAIASREPVSLEKCEKALEKAYFAAMYESDYKLEVKAVLDAAGVPYK